MSVYVNTARFDTGRALTEDELRQLAPSVFADTRHESRSERFSPIPTIEVLRGLAKAGFAAVGAKQASTRDGARREHTKHLIRLRRMDGERKYQVGDTVLEMLLKNANDGTSVYDLMAGLFRIKCLNSMVTQTNTLDTIKVRHSGHVMDRVIEGTFKVLEESERVLAAPQDWPKLKLSDGEQLAMARAAHSLRFADADGKVTTPVRPEQLLEVRRPADLGNDLWTKWNVVQENTMKGGITARGVCADGRSRRRTTRPIQGIEQDVKLNKMLWVLGEEMAKLKAA